MTEGTIIYYKDIIWVVKGIRHPPKFAIALPRYHTQGRVEMLDYAIWMLSDCVPYPLPHVPLKEAVVYDPRNLLRRSSVASRLAKKLEGFGCEFGLTGSLAVFGEGRDVDLIAYNEWCFEDLYHYLRELRERGRIKPLEGKWDGIGENLKRWRLEHSALEGILDGIPFSLKMVKSGERCRRPVKVRSIKVRGRMIAINDYAFPYLYKVNNLVVEALRLQYSELNGKEVIMRCDLEVWDDGEVCVLSKGNFLELFEDK